MARFKTGDIVLLKTPNVINEDTEYPIGWGLTDDMESFIKIAQKKPLAVTSVHVKGTYKKFPGYCLKEFNEYQQQNSGFNAHLKFDEKWLLPITPRAILAMCKAYD